MNGLLKVFLAGLLLPAVTIAAESATRVLMHAPYFSYHVNTTQFRAQEVTGVAHTYQVLNDKDDAPGTVTLTCLWLEPGADFKEWAEQQLGEVRDSIDGAIQSEYRFSATKHSKLRSVACRLTIQTREWNELDRVQAYLWHANGAAVIAVSAEGSSLPRLNIEKLCDSITMQRNWLRHDPGEAHRISQALNQASQSELESRSLKLADTQSTFRKALAFLAWPVVVLFRCVVALGLLVSMTLAILALISLPGTLLSGGSIHWQLCIFPLCLVMIFLGNLCDIPGGTAADKTDDWTAFAVGKSGKRYYWDPGEYSRPELFDDDLPSLAIACNNFAYQVQADSNVTEPIVARVLDISVGRFRRDKIVLQGPSLVWVDRDEDNSYWSYVIWRDAWWGNYGHTLLRPAFTRAFYTGPDCLPDNIDAFGDPKLSALEN